MCAWLEARFCRSTVEIRANVAAECGLNYSHSGCIKLLALLGFEYRKPKPLPRVASVQMQARFIALYERFIAEVIFLVFFTEPTRSRSSRMVAPICGDAVRATSGMETAYWLLRAASGAWKARAPTARETNICEPGRCRHAAGVS